MRFLSLVLAAVALTLPASAVPLSADVPQTGTSTASSGLSSATGAPNGKAPSGKLLVKLKDGASKADILDILGPSAESTQSHDWHVIQGFSGYFDEATANSLRKSPSVEHVEEDMIVQIHSKQTYAPWGLERISSANSLNGGNASALSYTYQYDELAGQDVDIYFVDTGINVNHTQFCGGRATWGATFGDGYPSIDDHGHGTHVAGTAAGNTFGVAKKANLTAVKVIDGQGYGQLSDVLNGLDFVYKQVNLTQRPSIVSMSLGGTKSFLWDSVVTGLVNAGIHVVVAAGNDNDDANNYSPAGAEGAIAVGAINITDERAWYSNYGKQVAIFAPGTDVVSAWSTDELAIRRDTGTSMATPHVSGLVAYLLATEGHCSPDEMKKRLQNHAIKGALKGIPDGTPNLLAQLPAPLKQPSN